MSLLGVTLLGMALLGVPPLGAALVPAATASAAKAADSDDSGSRLALELRGATYFRRAPWKVDLVSYNTIVSQPSARYYFTVEMAEDAGASLAALTIRQSRGVDNQFRFSPERTRAFVGRPRREGQAIAVQASFDEKQRQMRVTFPEPVAPGTTVTVMLKPWTNPSVSDTYMFQVQAFPAGPNPTPSSLGFATLRIYDPDWR